MTTSSTSETGAAATGRRVRRRAVAERRANCQLTVARLVRPYWRTLTVAGAAIALGSVADLLEPWPLKIAFDSILGTKPAPRWLSGGSSRAGAESLIAWTLAFVVASALLGAASAFVEKYLTTSVGERVTRDLRHVLYHHVERLSLTYFDRQRLGELLGRLTTDVDAVQDLVSDALLGIGVDVLTLAGMFSIMLALDWRFALVALAVTPCLAIAAFGFTSRIKASARAACRKESEIVTIIAETLASIRVVQAYAMERYEERRLDLAGNENVALALRARAAKASLGAAVEIIGAIGTCVVL